MTLTLIGVLEIFKSLEHNHLLQFPQTRHPK
jgi:hypothetical protein